MNDRRRKHWLLLVLIAALAANALACNRSGPQETDMTSTTQFHETRFGDAQGRSYLPVTGTLGREIAWTREPVDKKKPKPPRHLAIRNDELVVQYPRSLESRRRDTGEIQWSKRTMPCFEFQMTEDCLATMEANGKFTLDGVDGRELVQQALPLLTGSARLFRSWALGHEIRYAFSKEAVPSSDPDKLGSPSGSVYHRFDVGGSAFFWRYEVDDTLILTLLDEAGTRVALVASRGVHSFPPDASEDAQVVVYESDLIETAAYDFDDHLLLVLHAEGQRLLRRIDSAGKTDWEMTIPDGEIVQPPASAPDGHTYLLAGSKLMHVEAGRTAWTYDIPTSGNHRSRFTVLSDRTILLTAGTLCIQLREDGEELVRLDTGSKLAGRPIMDAAGRVYLGAKSWIRCYH